MGNMPFMDLGPCLGILVGGERKVGGVEAPCARATATDKHWEFKIFSPNLQTIFSHLGTASSLLYKCHLLAATYDSTFKKVRPQISYIQVFKMLSIFFLAPSLKKKLPPHEGFGRPKNNQSQVPLN